MQWNLHLVWDSTQLFKHFGVIHGANCKREEVAAKSHVSLKISVNWTNWSCEFSHPCDNFLQNGLWKWCKLIELDVIKKILKEHFIVGWIDDSF